MEIRRTIWFILAVWLLMACQQPDSQRREEDTQNLISIDDSMDASPLAARRMIGQAMKNAPDSITYYEYLSRLAESFNLSSTPDSITYYNQQVIRFAENAEATPRRNSLLAFAYNLKANSLHNFHQEEDEVVDDYKKSYALLQQSDNPSQMPDVCANIGDAYVFKNDLPQSAYWYRRALFLVDSLQLPRKDNVSLYVGLGRIYLLLGDFPASLKCYQQTEADFQKLPLNMQAYYLNNYGNYFYYAKDYKGALAKFLQLEQLLEKNGKQESYEMYLCQLNLSDVYLNLHQVEKAEKCLDIAEPYMRKLQDEVAIYYCNTIRIGLAMERDDTGAVARILATEKPNAQMDFSLRKIRNTYLRNFYAKKGRYQEAYDNLVADNLMNDSLEHNRISMRSTEIMQRFSQDTLRLHHQIAIEHKNAVIHESQSIIITVVALLVILLLLTVIFIVFSRKKQEKARLHVMQLRLNNARNRISPHFVFNVLNNEIINSGMKGSEKLLHLAQLIRANLDMSCQMEVSLQEELGFVRQYVEMERPLLGDALCYSVKIDSRVDAGSVRIPSMFVQILVENAFVHGLRGWEGKKKLDITVEPVEGGGVRIAVTDNGKGFDARNCMGKHRTGLGIITQTIAVVNERNKSKMHFELHNKTDETGKVIGCEGVLLIPQDIKYF